jgi:prophage antirepressor-like protein
MKNIVKIEDWNGCAIRFVEKDGEWWAVAADVCAALDIENVADALGTMPAPYLDKLRVLVSDIIESAIRVERSDFSPTEPFIAICYVNGADIDKGYVSSKRKIGQRKTQSMYILSELGIYRLLMRSNKPEALAFQDRVFKFLKKMREERGVELWKAEMFKISAVNHRGNMALIGTELQPQDKTPYAKVHGIVNKCIANIIGEPKAIKKPELKKRFPEMVPLRDEILSDTVNLMITKKRFGLNLSVSDTINRKYNCKEAVK